MSVTPTCSYNHAQIWSILCLGMHDKCCVKIANCLKITPAYRTSIHPPNPLEIFLTLNNLLITNMCYEKRKKKLHYLKGKFLKDCIQMYKSVCAKAKRLFTSGFFNSLISVTFLSKLFQFQYIS